MRSRRTSTPIRRRNPRQRRQFGPDDDRRRLLAWHRSGVGAFAGGRRAQLRLRVQRRPAHERHKDEGLRGARHAGKHRPETTEPPAVRLSAAAPIQGRGGDHHVTALLIGVEAVVIVLLMGALLYGQPSAVEATRRDAIARATENSWLRATVTAIPVPTRRPSNCTPYFYSC